MGDDARGCCAQAQVLTGILSDRNRQEYDVGSDPHIMLASLTKDRNITRAASDFGIRVVRNLVSISEIFKVQHL